MSHAAHLRHVLAALATAAVAAVAGAQQAPTKQATTPHHDSVTSSHKMAATAAVARAAST